MSACDSPVLMEVFKSVYDQFCQQPAIQSDNFGIVDKNNSEHQRIVDAALSGDAAECQQAIHDHLCRNLMTS